MYNLFSQDGTEKLFWNQKLNRLEQLLKYTHKYAAYTKHTQFNSHLNNRIKCLHEINCSNILSTKKTKIIIISCV